MFEEVEPASRTEHPADLRQGGVDVRESCTGRRCRGHRRRSHQGAESTGRRARRVRPAPVSGQSAVVQSGRPWLTVRQQRLSRRSEDSGSTLRPEPNPISRTRPDSPLDSSARHFFSPAVPHLGRPGLGGCGRGRGPCSESTDPKYPLEFRHARVERRESHRHLPTGRRPFWVFRRALRGTFMRNRVDAGIGSDLTVVGEVPPRVSWDK